MNIQFKQTHCGQHKRYGDFFREWDIETDITDKEVVLEYCFENIYKRRIPESAEYHKNIRDGSGHDGGANYYFAGYYTLKNADNGYKFVICEPYTD